MAEPSNPNQITTLDRKGFPRDVIDKLNEVIGAVNKPTEYKFATDSLDPIAKVADSPTKRVVTLPRAPAGQTGKSSNLYIMGTNSSTHDELTPWNDTWDVTNPPTVDGVVTTGVQIGGLEPVSGDFVVPFIRFAVLKAIVTKTIALDGGGSTPLSIAVYKLFIRVPQYDSLGKLIFIGPENDIGLTISFSDFS